MKDESRSGELLVCSMNSTPGITAADLARSLKLNRSTTSRQLAALMRSQFVAVPPGSTGRAQAVRITERGVEALAASRNAHLDRLEERLSAWSTGDIAPFADVLAAFNEPR
jgi:DNA-binding MarR family transcriptional regulator